MSHFQRLSGFAATDVGKERPNNEDALFLGIAGGSDVTGKKVELAITTENPIVMAAVADGVGGSAGGEIASQMALDTINKQLKQFGATFDQGNAAPLLEEAALEANFQIRKEIRNKPDLFGMATTLSAIIMSSQGAWLLHVGDSRCYRFRDKELEQVSMDHSPVAALLREGKISEDEALNHPLQSYIDQALGGEDDDFRPQPDVIPIEMQPGDRWMLCSDGLSDSLYPKQLKALFNDLAKEDCATIGQALIDAALKASGHDNTTLAIIDIPTLAQGLVRLFRR